MSPVNIWRDLGLQAALGVAQDVSEGGLRFRTRARYEVGERIMLHWGEHDETSARWGTVVRTHIDRERGVSEFPREVAIAFDMAMAA